MVSVGVCPSPDSYAEVWVAPVMVLGAGASRQCWSPKGGALLNGISALYRECSKEKPHHFCHVGTQWGAVVGCLQDTGQGARGEGTGWFLGEQGS